VGDLRTTSGVDHPVLHELMRHSSMQVTMDYHANLGEVLHEAIGGLK
jgi:hypothetical protein